MIAIRYFASCAGAVVLLAALAAPASADAIDDFDLTTFDFDVVNYTTVNPNGLDGNATASGTSNGIGWSVGPTNIWSGGTTTSGSYQFESLPAGTTTDRIHVSKTFTITFDQVIDTLVVALDNNGSGTYSADFGLSAVATRGVTVSGTQFTLASGGVGGLAIFQNVNSLTVTHTNNGNTDGFDLAFHAETAVVPEPGTLALLGLGLAGLGLGVRRRRRAAARF